MNKFVLVLCIAPTIFKNIYVHLFLHVFVFMSFERRPEENVRSPVAGVTDAMNHLVWVIGVELRSSTKALGSHLSIRKIATLVRIVD